jgi:hypothetical protein
VGPYLDRRRRGAAVSGRAAGAAIVPEAPTDPAGDLFEEEATEKAGSPKPFLALPWSFHAARPAGTACPWQLSLLDTLPAGPLQIAAVRPRAGNRCSSALIAPPK